MTKIFKQDFDIPEDINDLSSLLKWEIDAKYYLYKHINAKTIPLELTSALLDEFSTIYDASFEDENIVMKIIHPFYIIMDNNNTRISVLELDADDNAIYAYNLNSVNEDHINFVDKLLVDIDKVFNYAQQFNKRVNWKSNGASFEQLFLKLLNNLNAFKDITQNEFHDVLVWLGYATSNHTLN